MTTTVPRWVFELRYVPANGTFFASESDWNAMWGLVSSGATVSMNDRTAQLWGDPSTGEVTWHIEDNFDPEGETGAPPSLTLDLVRGENSLMFTAAFEDDQVLTEERRVVFDPSLRRKTGWIVDMDDVERTMTIAFAPYGSVDDEPWDAFGPVTEVLTLPVRADVVIVLLEPDSWGEPPEAVATFDEFATLVDQAITGECGTSGCFFASSGFAFTPSDEPGYPFAVLVTPDGEIQQIEQIWGP